MEEEIKATEVSPIEAEIEELFAKTERLTKKLSRLLACTESKGKPPKDDSVISDLQELNDRLADILDRLQI